MITFCNKSFEIEFMRKYRNKLEYINIGRYKFQGVPESNYLIN